MNLIFGINWKVGALIMIAILLLMYFQKYIFQGRKGVLLCIMGMIIAFYATLIASGGPAAGPFFTGITHWQFPQGSLLHSLAFISTHAAITAGVYGTYLGAEKKWKKEDLFNGTMFADGIAHVITVILISGAIVTVGAIVLHPAGLKIKAPAQMAAMLKPVLGTFANPVMGLALLGAAFQAFLVIHSAASYFSMLGWIGPSVLSQTCPLDLCCLYSLWCHRLLCLQWFSDTADFLANLATSIGTPTAGFL